MSDTATRPTSPIAVVGVGAIMPDAPDADAFWANITGGRYSISDVPPERWDPALYYSPDHDEPDKTYSKVGGWVRDFPWDPIRWKLPIPPKVADQMDDGQRWAIAAARAALVDAGWPDWKTDPDNVAVIIGNAIGGEKHYQTNMRIELPEVLRDLQEAESFAALSTEQREHILDETRSHFLAHYGEINEDTMPGELANVMAGRIANLFNFRGPNFTTDAACASGLAAMSVAVDGLVDHRFDAAITGGIDHNMGVAAFVKFCKIGALSATGTRPFDAGADGFVMGEGAALFVLKRLEDAERDGDRIYAVILGIAGSSDGKGKGITAPNPIGQRLAVERAWRAASEDPGTVDAIEAHGTSTRVGDATELQSLTEVFGTAGAGPQSIALGSVKSNIGHLKAAAGAAGAFKMVRSLHDKVLAPSLNFNDPNPNVDWDTSPFVVNTALRDWPEPPSGVRRGGVSAFGFGGTNFHVVLEEHVPGRHKPAPRVFAGASVGHGDSVTPANEPGRTSVAVTDDPSKPPPRGALVLGGRDDADLLAQVRQALADAQAGRAAAPTRPDPAVGRAARRIAVDFADAADLATKLDKAVKALTTDNPAIFRMLRQQGVFVGGGPAPKVAFLYTGQGSQYVNMLQALRTSEPIVDDTFREADEVMTPLLGRPLSSYIFVDGEDPAAVAQLEQQLLQTEITQPAVLATDSSISRLLGAYGMHPDMVMGHSLGEYGALIAAGSLTFAAALEAVSARGREMARLSVDDNGAMAAVFGPLTEIERIVDATPGYVVVANINSNNQAVVGGATDAVLTAIESFTAAGMQAVRIPVSHAFHTTIVAPASVPLVATLERLDVQPPRIPLVANVTGEFYPSDATSETMREYLGRQVASPVQFVKGLQTLYDAGARVFVEVGPKRALHGFVEDVLGEHDDVLSLYTNHPKLGDAVSINQALCGLWATGVGFETPAAPAATPSAAPAATTTVAPAPTAVSGSADDRIMQLGQLFAGVIEEGLRIYGAEPATPTAPEPSAIPAASGRRVDAEPVVVTGAALGLPGVEQTFDDANIARILDGQQFIDTLPDAARARMADMHITRLVKSESGGANFETIDDPAEVIKLAGRHAPLDIVEQFAVDTARDEALDNTTRLAIGAGFDALRDAGIPLVMRYKTTTLGTQLPDRWGLPDELRDDTGVIFASAFPGYDRFAEDVEAYTADRARREHLLALEGVRARMDGTEPAVAEVDRLIANLRAEMEAHPYGFDRRFLFRVLSMGHSQFAEIIGARGPNTQVNAACASTTQAISLAEDWIRAGRCRRVVVVSADDATADSLMPWIASGFLASGAAATDEHVEDAATPFDRRRHGMIVGMGAASLVVESAEAARERGLQPICEVLGAITANSAFHGTRLDVEHIGAVMEAVIEQAESRGVRRSEIAGEAMFVSHETYTPARGGSAAAEINALRRVFGPDADRVVITNTKGFTGHAMGAGIEDVVAVKALETGIVPPVPNYREPDPDLGNLNLSHGGAQPVRYGLRLAAGFGSQVAMALLRWTPLADGRHRSPDQLGYAYRIVDAAAWQRWLDLLAGHDGARLETDHRRLRVVDVGAPATSQHESAVPVPYAGQLGASALRTLPAATTPPPADAAPPPVPAPEPVLAAPTEAVVAAAPAAVASAPEPAATPAVDDVLAQVTAVVAEMTGYPTELLEPDLDLEADLGVDTVKQAEVFAAVRTHYELERDDNLQLRDFPTLRHVAEWVRERAGLDAAAPAAAEPGAASVSASASEPAVVVAVDDVLAQVTAVVAEMTGYPMELLEPDLDLEADLGVDTVKQAEVFAAVRTHYELERDDNLQLRDFPTLRHVADWVRARAGLDSAQPAAAEVKAPAATATAPAVDDVLAQVTAVVAEMTGYPTELLEPDLDLEADLGVDTVKQAEVFAAVRTHYELERDDNLQLRDFPTLRHVADWVRARAGLDTPAPAEPAAAPEPAAAAGVDDVLAQVTAVVAEMTGYPTELLEPDLDLEADLGVDTVKQAEVFAAVRTQYELERDDNLQLRDFPTLRHVADWVRARAGLDTPAPAEPAPAAAPEPAAAAGVDDVLAQVTAVVAEMTGYPMELLEPDLDLEADLGVDTVKQAEVFAAVRTQYELERDDNLQLRDFPTLRHVADWVRARAGLDSAQPAAAEVTAPAATAPAPAVDDVLAQVTAVVAEMTGYPMELLEPDLDLEADLGVDTVKQAEVFAAVRTQYELERDDNLQLRDFPTLRHVADWVRARAGLDTPAPAEPAPAAAPEPAAAAGVDDVLAQVTAVVAEMTGYPMELLEPDLDLEADLGVDTVKQAEVFAAVRTQYELERDDNLQLRDFPTLRHVADWVRARAGLDTPAPAGGTPATAGGAPATAAAPAAPRVVHGDFDAVDALPRRIPVPSLRPPVTDCLPTGVALDGARIIVMLDEGGVGEALVKQLDKAGAEVLTLEPGTATDALLAQVEAWHADAPITGVYWLPALDDDGDLAEYDLPTWREALRRRVKTLYATMRCLYDASPFLVSATRLGGYHGYDADGATNPLGGPVTGFTKSYRKERPEALVKAVDLAPSRKTSAIAAQLIEETLFDPGCVEIGRVDDRRFGVAFVEAPFPQRSDDGQPLAGSGMTLGHHSVVVVTGAAGSIVSAITADLAAASGGTFHLLDLTSTPDASDPDLEAFRADRNGLKVTIAERMKVAGDHPTPVTIERELARFERLDAALTAIQSVEAAGGTVHYHSVDLTDADAVAAAIDDVRRLSGRIDVLLHAAGLEISRNLPDKETREYDLVFDVKSDGWFNVFHAAQDMEIGATVVFSSVAGRFGNQGQTDYSAANDLLCKITSNFRRSRPETRGLALDWTAWGGIGMATRGSIPKIMEMAGVQMLPPEAGVAWIRRELLSSEYTGEVIVAGALGMMATEYDDRGGVDLTSVVGDGVDRGPMIGHAVVSVHHGVVVETTLDPLQQPFLHDHRIDGTPVLPGVMGMEAFAETARLLAPDHHVLAVEDVSFAAPLKFYRDEPRTLTVQAVLTPDGDGLEAQCTLSAERQLPGRDEPQRTVHFTGRVRLGPEAPATEQIEPPGDPTGSTLGAEQVYSFYFHGPAYQVVSEAWRDGDASVATLMDPLPDNHVPPEQPLATAPRLIELCFQTAGLWQAGLEDRLALPMRVGRARWYATPEADAPLRAVARETAAGVFDCVVVDSSGTVVARLDRYETIPLPAPIPDSVAGALHATYRV